MNAPLSIMALRQLPVEPPEAFSKAMPPELFKRLRLQPVPVLFLEQQPADEGYWQWRGFCSPNSFTEFGEVTLDTRLVERGEWEPVLERIQAVYLHEVAHRLMPGQWHNAAFHAMALVLYLRVGETNSRPLWHSSKLYDWQDEEDLPRAFSWAWNIANKLAKTEEAAEQCAQIIQERYKAWRAWAAAEPERKAALEAKKQAQAAAQRQVTKTAIAQIQRLKDSRFWCAFGSAVVGILATVCLELILKS